MSKYDKASLVMIPSAYKAEKLYSVLPENGNGDFTHDRSTTATRVNKDGLIESVAADVPRLDYPLIDGVVSGCPSVLLEPQRRNLLPYSEDFTQWSSKVGITITENYGISPDGTQNSSRVVFNGSGNELTQIITTGASTTGSIYIKGVSGETINFGIDGSEAIFILNGKWQRFEKSGTSTNNKITVNTYSNATARDIEVWGAQLEEGSYPTSYIPTSGSSVTRSAETCGSAGNASTFNDSEGVLFADFRINSSDSYQYLSLSDGSNSNNIRFNLSPTANQISFEINSGGSLQANYINNNTNVLLSTKVSVKYKQNDFSIWINGFKLHTDLSGSTPIGLDKINFDRGNGGNPFYGNTKEIATFKEALTDSELEDLTSWDSFKEMAQGQLYTIR